MTILRNRMLIYAFKYTHLLLMRSMNNSILLMFLWIYKVVSREKKSARAFTICQGHALPDCNPLVRHWERRDSRTKTSHYDTSSFLEDIDNDAYASAIVPRSKAREGLKHCRRLSRVVHGGNVMLNDDVGFSFRCYVVVPSRSLPGGGHHDAPNLTRISGDALM